MKESAGVVVIWKNKVLVAHPSNASWFKTYSPPKGGIEKGESHVDAAVRETYEEIGIKINKNDLLAPIDVDYINQKGVTYKRVTIFPIRIKDLSEINLKTEKVPLAQLQIEEVDDARFMTIDEMKERVMPRFFEPLKNLIEKFTLAK